MATCVRPERSTITIQMAEIPKWPTYYGSPENEPGRLPNEIPFVSASFDYPFLMGIYPVTQIEWYEVMNSAPSSSPGPRNPVEQVTWDDAWEFIRRLNLRLNIRGIDKFRLPTEMEWEHACRAGSGSAWHFGDNAKDLDRYAWSSNSPGDSTMPVGLKEPNAFGLYDMHGNVSEWVDKPYRPLGEAHMRLHRGGSWLSAPSFTRSASRGMNWKHVKSSCIGFRLARSIPRFPGINARPRLPSAGETFGQE